jgi:hypothetical protein
MICHIFLKIRTAKVKGFGENPKAKIKIQRSRAKDQSL